ncbi:MAG TPA: RNA-binding protein [Candidatus Saccharimonadales bacterium]|nr:RNA-binding protein [Candidatus Saccharimonadales bacterium]
MTKLYVGNLPYSVNDQALADMFAAYGTVNSSTVIIDKGTGRSKGFGFVELEADEMAQNAINELNGKDMQGRNLVVSVARPMEPRAPRSGGFDRNRNGGSRY